MTLDKAIIDYDKMSKHQEWLMKQNINHGGTEYQKIAKVNIKKAEEYHQFAEWLKDYKRLKEKEEPKMVIYSGDGYADGSMVYDIAECPVCGRRFDENEEIETWECKFCPECGQALKFEVEE